MRIYPVLIRIFVACICGVLSLFSFQWIPTVTQPVAIPSSPTDEAPILPSISPSASPTINPTITPTVVEPFVNLSDLLLVTVEFYTDKQPLLISVQPLETGRITPSRTGDTHLNLIDAEGKTVFDISFTPVFVFGEPARKHESVRMVFITPSAGAGSLIQISSPEWMMEYKIDGN